MTALELMTFFSGLSSLKIAWVFFLCPAKGAGRGVLANRGTNPRIWQEGEPRPSSYPPRDEGWRECGCGAPRLPPASEEEPGEAALASSSSHSAQERVICLKTIAGNQKSWGDHDNAGDKRQADGPGERLVPAEAQLHVAQQEGTLLAGFGRASHAARSQE